VETIVWGSGQASKASAIVPLLFQLLSWSPLAIYALLPGWVFAAAAKTGFRIDVDFGIALLSLAAILPADYSG
jgi:hypothetical protein